jgi:hypothetical protein
MALALAALYRLRIAWRASRIAAVHTGPFVLQVERGAGYASLLFDRCFYVCARTCTRCAAQVCSVTRGTLRNANLIKSRTTNVWRLLLSRVRLRDGITSDLCIKLAIFGGSNGARRTAAWIIGIMAWRVKLHRLLSTKVSLSAKTTKTASA